MKLTSSSMFTSGATADGPCPNVKFPGGGGRAPAPVTNKVTGGWVNREVSI